MCWNLYRLMCIIVSAWHFFPDSPLFLFCCNKIYLIIGLWDWIRLGHVLQWPSQDNGYREGVSEPVTENCNRSDITERLSEPMMCGLAYIGEDMLLRWEIPERTHGDYSRVLSDLITEDPHRTHFSSYQCAVTDSLTGSKEEGPNPGQR